MAVKLLRLSIIYLVLHFFFGIDVYSQHQMPNTVYTKDTIILATEPDYPPYCVLDENGKASGFAVELFMASAEEAGLTVKVEVGPWMSIRQRLWEGKVDALPIVADMPARKEQYDFSIPYLSLQGNIFVNKKGFKVNSLDDLKRARVYVMRGDNSEEYLREKGYAKQIITTSTFDEAFEYLANGDADAVVTQRIIGAAIIQRHQLKSIAVAPVDLPDYRLNFCFAVKNGNTDLIDRLNGGLSIVMATGRYNDIHLKWLGPVVHQKPSLSDFIKLALLILVPIIVLFSLAGVLFLRREVRNRTRYLNDEILEHEKTLEFLRQQKQLVEYSESQIRLLLNSTAEGIYGIDMNGCCVLINRSALELLGYADESEVLGKNMHQLIHHTKADGSVYLSDECIVYRALKMGMGVHETEEVFWRSNGVSFEVEYFSHPIRVDGLIQGAVITFWDITERKKQESALKESESKFRSLFDNHSAAKMMIDPVTYQIVEVNSAAVELYGYSKDYMIGNSVEIFLTYSKAEIKRRVDELLDVRRRHGEYRHKKAGGKFVDVEVFNSIIQVGGKEYIHSIVHDITEKKKNEQQLRLLSAAVEQNTAIMMITDKDGVIQYVNTAFCEITGYQQEDVVGKTPRILKSGYHPRAFYENLWATITSGNTCRLEFYNRKKDGSFYWENASISPIFDSDGELTHFVAVKDDVTDKKELIKDLMVAKNKAEESDRLKSAFMANMSHEIRTPMNSIMGFLELLQDPEVDKIHHHEYFRIIKRSSKRLLNTINDIIEISKLESGITNVLVQSVSMNKFLNEIHAFFQSDAKVKNLKFELNNQLPDGFHVVTDKNRLETILLNLLKNAFKFTAQGFVELGAELESDAVLLWVKDSGLGIERENLNLIFERFRQAEITLTRNYEGSGLGLSISKSNAELINANLWCESEYGKGSQFYLQLPLVENTNGTSFPTLN